MPTLLALLVAIGLLSTLAVAATLREVARDGLRAIPTDPQRVPDRRPLTKD
jgi:hypothetical protein